MLLCTINVYYLYTPVMHNTCSRCRQIEKQKKGKGEV